MTLRLRTGPPRRQRGSIPGTAMVGLAALAVLGVILSASRLRGSSSTSASGSVYIQRLDGVAAEALLPPTPRPFLDRHRIVAYYGNPLAAGMGVLGEYQPEEIVRRLRAQADVYQRLDPSRTVVPAVHFIY